MWRVRKQEDLYVFLDEDAKDIEIGYGMFIEEKDLEQLKTMQIRFRTEEERIRRKEEINKLLIEAKEKAQKLGEQYQNYWKEISELLQQGDDSKISNIILEIIKYLDDLETFSGSVFAKDRELKETYLFKFLYEKNGGKWTASEISQMPIPGFEDEMGEYGISHMKVSVYCKHLIEKNVLKMDEEGKRKLYYVIGKENPKN